jgi:predicted small lipoprotein YifL
MSSRSTPRRSARRKRRWLAALACVIALAGCGGGLFLGFELGGPDDQPPSVALTAAVSEAPALATVRLAAAASDDFGVDAVSFYREEAAGPATLLGTDNVMPYQFDAVIPAGPAGTVWRYFARAFDGAGQHGDSAVVEITVR